MKLVEVFEKFTDSPDENMRALFDSSMQKSEEFGQGKYFSIQDILYEVFQCQLEIHRLKKITETQRRRRSSRKL